MRIATEQLAQHLQRGMAEIYAVFGDEPLLALEAADRIRQAARAAGHDDRELIVVEPGFDWSRLLMAGASLSLFGSRRVLDVRVPSGKPGKEGGAALRDFCARPPADTVTLFSFPEIDWQGQKSEWFAALEQAAIVVEAKQVPRERLPKWIEGRLATQGQAADAETLQFLADKVEGNLMAAFQEIRKLALLYPAGPLAFEQVKDAVLDVARYDADGLGVAMLEGDAARFARILDGLRAEGVGAPLVLWVLAADIRTLRTLANALARGMPLPQALKQARVWRDREAPVKRAVGRLKGLDLDAALLEAAAADRAIKGIGGEDPWEALLRLGERVMDRRTVVPIA